MLYNSGTILNNIHEVFASFLKLNSIQLGKHSNEHGLSKTRWLFALISLVDCSLLHYV